MLKKRFLVLSALVIVGLLLAACGGGADTSAAEARVAELEAQLAAAAGGDEDAIAALEEQLAAAEDAVAAAEAAASGQESYSVEFKNPDTYIYMAYGDVDTLDPAVQYDNVSSHLTRQLYDTLVFPKGESVDEFVPMLATDWTVSDDGLTYVFTIREGVTFHEGGTLEPHDVAYSFHRNMLTGWDGLEMGGPMGLYFDPMLGKDGIGNPGDGGQLDVIGGEEMAAKLEEIAAAEEAIAAATEANASEAELETLNADLTALNDELAALVTAADPAVCESIKDTVVADDDAGTVTIKLSYPAGFFTQLVAGNWASVMDSEWMIEQGDWDGSCDTWRNWYGRDTAETTLYEIANGTGPYKLESLTHGDEIVMTANENWWVTEPLWEGSTIDGPAKIKTYVYKVVNEWGTRLASFQAGDADSVLVDTSVTHEVEPMVAEIVEYTPGAPVTANPNGIFRLYWGMPRPGSSNYFMNQDVSVEGGNPMVGSGEMDGNGIPATFFQDEHVRRAFAYCFDYDTYIQEVLSGEGIRSRGAIIAPMIGYNVDSVVFEYDLEKCAEEMALAYDGQLLETGFSVDLMYNLGNNDRRIASEILRDGLQSSTVDVNGNFIIGITSLPWPAYLAATRQARVPAYLIGWGADYMHPHNFVGPFMQCDGYYGRRQGVPDADCQPWDELIYAAVRETDPDAARAMYEELQAAGMNYALDIFISQPLDRNYQQLWISGWYPNNLMGTNNLPVYLAAMSKIAPE